MGNPKEIKLQIKDSALVVVGWVEDVFVQTETMLPQALSDAIKPSMTINKLKSSFLEMQLDANDIYET